MHPLDDIHVGSNVHLLDDRYMPDLTCIHWMTDTHRVKRVPEG